MAYTGSKKQNMWQTYLYKVCVLCVSYSDNSMDFFN